MIVGILKEVKVEENRVSMTPAGVEVMRQHGHTVLVEKNAGTASGFDNASYIHPGVEIIDGPEEIYNRADMIMHVKDLSLRSMCSLRKPDHLHFSSPRRIRRTDQSAYQKLFRQHCL